MKLSDEKLNAFAVGIARLIEDLEKSEDDATDITASETTTDIQAAKEVEGLRQKLTGYQAADGAVGASPELQREILDIKAQLRDLNQPTEVLEVPPSGWTLDSDNPRQELACRRHEYDALVKAGDLQRQITCLDRIRQLEMMVARG